jgi:serine/threonine protein kinase
VAGLKRSEVEGEDAPTTAEERGYLERLLVSSKPKEINSSDFYSFGKVVGVGSFAKVRIARHKLTGQQVAIKTYEKTKMKDPAQLRRINQEIKLMEKLDHPLIIRFLETIESAKRIHLVMEFMGGGNLCTYVAN